MNDELLGRYVAGEASPDEIAAVRRWLAEHPVDARLVAALSSGRLSADRPIDVDNALRAVRVRNAAFAPTHRLRLLGLAAAAAIVLAAGALLGRQWFTGGAQVLATAVGQRDSLVLADGSRVLLAPDSRVEVRGRNVRLEGTAYFVVAHDEERPFVVRSGPTVIRDIGTEFAVRAEPSGEVRVVVTEGSVEIASGERVTVAAGDIAEADGRGRVSARRGAATPDDVAWTRGRLVFRDATLPEVLRDLRRWYGVEVVVTDSALLDRHFTGAFTDESASRIVDVLALALGARAERRGATYHLSPTPISR